MLNRPMYHKNNINLKLRLQTQSISFTLFTTTGIYLSEGELLEPFPHTNTQRAAIFFYLVAKVTAPFIASF